MYRSVILENSDRSFNMLVWGNTISWKGIGIRSVFVFKAEALDEIESLSATRGIRDVHVVLR